MSTAAGPPTDRPRDSLRHLSLPPASGGLKLAALRRLFAKRDARRLLGAQFLAQTADGFSQAVLAFVLLLDPLKADAPGRILSVFALTLLPYSVISPFMGVVVDRVSRRKLLVNTNLLRAAMLVSAPLWVTLLPGQSGLYGALLVLMGCGRLFLTTKNAVLPVVLGDDQLLRANAASGGGGMVSALAGGVAGVAAVGFVSPRTALMVSGTIYFVAALLASRISVPLGHGSGDVPRLAAALGHVTRNLARGLIEIWRQRRARLALIGIFMLRIIGMTVVVAAILVIKRHFPGAGDRGGKISLSTLAIAAAGVGAFAGALTTPALGRRLQPAGVIIAGFLVSGTAVVALGGLASVPALLGLTFAGGYGGFLSKVAADASVQAALPDDLRGRAFALYDLLYNVASVVAAAVMVVFQHSSLRAVLLPLGLVTLAAAAVLGRSMRHHGMELLRATTAQA